MKTKVIIFIGISLSLIVLAVLSLTGNFPPNYSSIGNPTAKDILNENPNADILKLDGLIYSNVSEREWVKVNEYIKGEKIGDVKKQTTNTWWYRNLYATKLSEGTKIYTTNGQEYKSGEAPVSVLVEHNNKLLVYQSLREG